MRISKLLKPTLFLVLISPFALAQGGLRHRDLSASESVLGPDDQLVLQITDMEELSNKPFRVDSNGYVDIPMAGRLQVSGLTIEQFREQLAAKLSKFIQSPQITINVTDNQSRPVSVLGAVNSPGVQQIHGPKHLVEVISLAGGVRQDAGPRVVVTRQSSFGAIPVASAAPDKTGGFTTASFSLDDLMAGKAPESNILVQPGDVVSVPKADLVYVVGDVRKPGGFMLSTHETLSLLQALSLAEGFGPDPSPKGGKILREAPGGDGTPREIPVDIRQIFAGKAPDVRLYANDILFVPSSTLKVVSRRAIESAIGVGTGVLVYRR